MIIKGHVPNTMRVVKTPEPGQIYRLDSTYVMPDLTILEWKTENWSSQYPKRIPWFAPVLFLNEIKRWDGMSASEALNSLLEVIWGDSIIEVNGFLREFDPDWEGIKHER